MAELDHPYPFRIEVRPLLTHGAFGFGPGSIFILLANNQSRDEATQTLWHEIVHMLKRVKGPGQQNEEEVEQLAKKLAAACPDVLSLCGLDGFFLPVNKS